MSAWEPKRGQFRVPFTYVELIAWLHACKNQPNPDERPYLRPALASFVQHDQQEDGE